MSQDHDELEFVNKDVSTLNGIVKATQADLADAAARGHAEGMQAAFIDIETPQARTRIAGDTSIQTVMGESYIDPPEDPDQMWAVYQVSSFLEPVIDAVVSNVYGTGYVLEPAIDLYDKDTREYVRAALGFKEGRLDDASSGISDDEVTKKIDELKRRAERERMYLDWFFRVCTAERPYEELEELIGQELEVTGNAYYEVTRDSRGQIARFYRAQSRYIRVLAEEPTLLAARQPVRHPVLGISMVQHILRPRRYAQIDGASIVAYFKEFGDPRVMSRQTGKFYNDLAGLQAAEAKRGAQNVEALAATELLHVRMPFAGSMVYGKPSWSGAYPSQKGARDLDEYNMRLVCDEDVPSLLLAIAGPRIGTDEIKAFREQVEQRRKRKGGILFLNAWHQSRTPGAPTPTASMHVERLRSEQTTDAIFQNYEQRAEDKADTAYRLPRSLRGKDVTQGRAALAAFRYAENYVFEPRRARFARIKNDKLFPAMSIYCWNYRCRPRPPRDPEALADVLGKLASYGFITPTEGRDIMAPALDAKLPELPGAWTSIPQKLLTAVLQTKNKELAAVLLGGGPEDVERLSQLVKEALRLAGEGGDAPGAAGEEQDESASTFDTNS